MRRAEQVLAAVGAVLLVVGACVAFAVRREDTSGGVTTLLVAGSVLTAGALALWVRDERHAGGLLVPEGSALPVPHWETPLLVVAAVDLVAGALASRPMIVLGAVLAAAAAVRLGTRRRTTLDRTAVVAARRVQAFGSRHAVDGEATVEGSVQHVGRGATRLVLVGRDGTFGDTVLRSSAAAEEAARLSGMTVLDAQARELGDRLQTGPYVWRRMAGTQLERAPR
jgi:hypothetical protein